MNNQIQPFQWGDVALSQVVYLNGIPHATRQAIGEWLEYADPQKAIDKLIERNPHVEHYSTPVNLTGMTGQKYEASAYHPIGFLLIVMESGQPKALACKVAVAEFVWHFAGPREVSFKQEIELMKLQRALVGDLSRTKDAFARQLLTERLSRVCLQLGQPMPDLKFLGKDANQLDLGV